MRTILGPLVVFRDTRIAALLLLRELEADGVRPLREATIRFTFSLEDSQHLIKEWRKQQTDIVNERNRLVHRFLSECDLTTIEGCESSALILDQQRERMISAAQSIESMVDAVREAFEDIQSGKAQLTL